MKKVLMFSMVEDLFDPTIINGEREYMGRLIQSLQNLQQPYIITDRYGNVYDYQKQEFTGQTYRDFDVSVAFCNHYTEFPFVDVHTIMALWNPLSYLCHVESNPMHQDYRKNHSPKQFQAFESYDDFITPSPRQSDIFNKFIGQKQVRFNEYPLYLPTVSQSNMMQPAQQFKKIFYVGVSWENLIKGKITRHSYELSNLSNQGLLNIYGPQITWKNQADSVNYMGEIPADGQAIFQTIHDAGITLALASVDHVISDIATNRIFEGIAAGTIVISNIKGHVYDMFGDNILYIDANQNPEQRLQQINDHYNWIQQNTETVSKMVENAQQILRDKYCLEILLNNVISQLPQRQEQLKNSREISTDNAPQIDLIYVCPSDPKNIENDIVEILKQNYPNLQIHIFTAQHKSLITEIMTNQQQVNYKIIDQYCDNTNYYNVFEYAYQNNFDLTSIFTAGSHWKHNFLSILSRLLVDNPEKQVAMAKSGIYNQNVKTRYGVRDICKYNDIAYFDYQKLYEDIDKRLLNISSLLFKISYFKNTMAPTTWAMLGDLPGLYMTMSALYDNKLIVSQYILITTEQSKFEQYLNNLNQDHKLLLSYILPQPITLQNTNTQSSSSDEQQAQIREQYMSYKQTWRKQGLIGKIMGYVKLRKLRNKYKQVR